VRAHVRLEPVEMRERVCADRGPGDRHHLAIAVDEPVLGVHRGRVRVAVRLGAEDCVGLGSERVDGRSRPAVGIVVAEPERVLVEHEHIGRRKRAANPARTRLRADRLIARPADEHAHAVRVSMRLGDQVLVARMEGIELADDDRIPKRLQRGAPGEQPPDTHREEDRVQVR
jgi:hypothetical protein